MQKRPWWDVSLEWLIVVIAVVGLSPFILTAVFALGCYLFGDSNSCTVLGWFQDVQ